MPRESSKCRQWEKERRERLNDAFDELAKVLPCYDPSVAISKIDILRRAALNIQELQEKINILISSNQEKKLKTEDVIVKKLQDRVKKLLVRNEQLSNLLRDAGINVPSACGTIKKFNWLPWSKRINAEQAKVLQKKEIEKENASSKSVQHKKKKTKTVNSPTKHRTVIVNGVEQKVVTSTRRRNKKKSSLLNYFIVLSQVPAIRRQQVYLIPSQLLNNSFKNPIKSGVISKPMIVAPKSKPVKYVVQVNPPTNPPLGPGTLVLADGTIMPVVPQIQPNPIYTLPKTVKTEGNDCDNKSSNKMIINKLPFIQPKYCLTRTTQVNKVPIPALTSRYANNYVLLNNSKKENAKVKEPVKKPSEPVTKSNKTELIRVDRKRAVKRKNDASDKMNVKKSKSECNTDKNADKSGNLGEASASTETDLVAGSEVSKSNVEDPVEAILKKPVAEEKNEEAKAEESTKKVKMQLKTNVVPNLEDPTPIFEKQPIETTSNENISTNVTVTTASTTNDDMKHLDLNLPHSELSNDIFASLQVPSGCQNPESTSPTAAFLLAFPLVSSGVKVTEVIDEENSESQRGTPNLLQIGTLESTKPTQSDAITSNFLNLDNFSFFSSKDICGSFYNNYSKPVASTVVESSGKTDTTTSASIYVNVKSPCLPTSAAEPIKENYNALQPNTTSDSKEVAKLSMNSCDKSATSQKPNDNFATHNPTGLNINSCDKSASSQKPNNFAVHNPAGLNANNCDKSASSQKPNDNFPLHNPTNSSCTVNAKGGNQAQKPFNQKPQYYPPATFSNANSCTYTAKTCAACSSASINRNYTNPLYTNCNNYSYNYHHDTNFNQNYYKNLPRNDAKAYYPLNYDNYTDYRKTEPALPTRYYEGPTYVKDKKTCNAPKVKPSQNKQPINWMTTPDNRLQTSECLLNSFSKGDFSQTYPFNSYVTTSSTYFTTSTIDTSDANCAMEAKKCLDFPMAPLNPHQQRPEAEEKQFSWSPTKLPHFLDPPHNFVTPTLPTLVGDLALGNPLSFAEQKNIKDAKRSTKVSSYENQTNFLSVSQLVDHNKPESVPAKTATRRNSGNRSRSNTQTKVKRSAKQDNKDIVGNCVANDKLKPANNYILPGTDLFPVQNMQKNRNMHKNVCSSYSAEALIGHQAADDALSKKYHPPATTTKSLGASSFLAENIISCFPPVDIPQENYMTQNQNYQTNFTSFQNNTYSTNSFIYTAPTITPSYLSANNFETTPHDYLQDNLSLAPNAAMKDNKHFASKPCATRQPSKEDKNSHHGACVNNLKRLRRKAVPETNNGLANFDFPFLTMPASNNSPILPDDFHSHTTFLPPATPFSCKNSLYSKQTNDMSAGSLLPLPPVTRSNIQHPEISPSVGTSLTNFNLSTIFPEINKGQITEMYPAPGIKEHSNARNYTSAPPQVPFNTEPKFNFSM